MHRQAAGLDDQAGLRDQEILPLPSPAVAAVRGGGGGWHGGEDQSFDLGRCSEPPMIAVRYTCQNGAL